MCIAVFFSLIGYLFSCFLMTIGGELPLEPTKDDYIRVLANELAIDYVVIGFIIGICINITLNFLKKIISKKRKYAQFKDH